MHKRCITVLGAGFGGLELTSILSKARNNDFDIILIDKNDTFFFGSSKLDIMIGRKSPEEILHEYNSIIKPGVRFIQTTIRSINPILKRVITDDGILMADILVIALGADYDFRETPGLKNSCFEFYSFNGAKKLAQILPQFKKGKIVIGITSTPFKCPPAPSEAALLLHDFFTKHGVRNNIDITLVMPFDIPIPPSPEGSQKILKTFAKRNISFIPNQIVRIVDPESKKLELQGGIKIPYDLFLAIPKHKVPAVIENSELATDGWIPVNQKTLETKFENVYAIGDVTSVGTPKAGVFAEGAARTVADLIIAKIRGGQLPLPYNGAGSCYMEFGSEMVGRIDVNFLSQKNPTGFFFGPSKKLVKEKLLFGKNRIELWFGK